jgi:hypothetical protein
MNMVVLVGFRVFHMPPHPYGRSQCGPHQRHERQHQEAVQYFDQHRFQGYQKKRVRPHALDVGKNSGFPIRNAPGRNWRRVYFADMALSTSSAVRGSPALRRTSLPSASTQNISSMRTPRFSSGM